MNKKALMKKDVNLGLLLLIVATLIMFSGFTVYYKTTFQNISKNYDTQLKELQKVTDELKSKRAQLNETSVQLKLKQEREEDLNVKYTDVRSDRDTLQTAKTSLEGELAGTKADLASKVSEIGSLQTTIAGKDVTIAEKESIIADKEKTISNLKSQKSSLEDKVSCLQSKVDGEESTC